jgi:hypothetical protein
MKRVQFPDKVCKTCGASYNRRRLSNGLLEKARTYSYRSLCPTCQPVRSRRKSTMKLKPRPPRPPKPPKPLTPLETKTCEACGNTFERKRGPDGRPRPLVNWEAQKYCSIRCCGDAKAGVVRPSKPQQPKPRTRRHSHRRRPSQRPQSSAGCLIR